MQQSVANTTTSTAAKTKPVVDEWVKKDPLIQKFYDQFQGQ